MAIIIEHMLPADAPAAAQVAEEAFATDPFHLGRFPKDMTVAQTEEYRQWRIGILQSRMAKENARYFKAIDESSGSMVGFAAFHGPTSKEDTGPRWPGSPDFLIGADADAEMFKRMRQLVLGDRNDVWLLQSMGVHPDSQGRGIAGQLMRAGLEVIDHFEGECYVEATPVAARLYAKSGFELKETVGVLNGTYVLSAMLRPARTLNHG